MLENSICIDPSQSNKFEYWTGVDAWGKGDKITVEVNINEHSLKITNVTKNTLIGLTTLDVLETDK